MTYEPLDNQLELFGQTSSAEDSLAKTYPWLDAALDWLASEAGCGGRCTAFSLNCVLRGS